jgi:hypothetical protein
MQKHLIDALGAVALTGILTLAYLPSARKIKAMGGYMRLTIDCRILGCDNATDHGNMVIRSS